ncbi:MAG TPA: glycosyltransferase family 2 protein [Candidatus Thermoplasmatota archaeon]|nr:glycosyltransferase family 2 protein [Candidatus Thermoplasmatota archaeon]
MTEILTQREPARTPVLVTPTKPTSLGRVTILIPTKNEEAGIGQTLDALPLEALDEAGYETEVIVVDGHSTDATRDIAAQKGAKVILQKGKGKGWGFRSALPHITGDYLIMLDADGTYPAEAIPEFVKHVSNGSDVIMGSRFKGHIEAGAMKRTNKIGNWGLSTLATVLYGKRCTDVCTGMWAFKRDAVKTLKLNSLHYELEAELFAQSAKAGLRIKEVPIVYRQRAGKSGLNSWKDGAKIAAKLLRKRVVK